MATPTPGRSGAYIIGDIEGGEAPTRLDMDENITADHIYATYRRYPKYKSIIKLHTDAIWSNWLSEETIELDRLIECKDCCEDAINYGWAIIIVDATMNPPRCERWHCKIEGTGAAISETSKMGFPLKAKIMARFNEAATPMDFEVEHYPCEVVEIKIGETEDGRPIYSQEYVRDRPLPGKRGFFLIRTRGGKKGIRGLPQYLDLIMLIRKAYDIVENYCTYAENQALALTAVGLERNTKPNKDSIKEQFTSQVTHRKLLMIGKEDWVEWVSPMNSAWDPWSMLEYINTVIAQDTQMNKLMMEGDATGALEGSDTMVNNWETKTKERQAYWLGQFRPIFKALGATEEVSFADPAKPKFISLMEGLKAAREALIDIVENEDIVSLFNEYLQKHGHNQELTPISNEEMNKRMMGDNENGNSERTSDKRPKTSEEK